MPHVFLRKIGLLDQLGKDIIYNVTATIGELAQLLIRKLLSSRSREKMNRFVI